MNNSTARKLVVTDGSPHVHTMPERVSLVNEQGERLSVLTEEELNSRYATVNVLPPTGVEATDTALLEAAVDALPASGGRIILHPGVYVASWAIDKANVMVMGSWDSVVRTPPNATPGVNDASIRLLADRCRVVGIQIDGNLANQVATNDSNGSLVADGVGIYANECEVAECWIRDTAGHGAIVWNTAFGSKAAGQRTMNTIRDNLFTGGSIHRSRVDVAINAIPNANRHTHIIGNRFRGCFSGITIHGGTDVLIANNLIFDCGVPLRAHFTIERLTFVDNIVIAGPTYQGGLHFDATSTTYRDIICARNIVSPGTGHHGMRFSGGVSGMSNTIIADNRIISPGARGIELDGIHTNVTISRNIITDPVGNSCIHIGATAADVEIVDNICRRSGNNGITVRSSGGVRVARNRIKDAAIGVNLPSPEFATNVTIEDDNEFVNVTTRIAATGSSIRQRRGLARKGTDQTQTANTTLANDTALVLPVVANRTYQMRLQLHLNSGATPDFKLGWSLPSGATMRWGITGALTASLTEASVPSFNTTGADQMITYTGTLVTSATAGNCQLQWTQNTSDPGNTTVLAASTLELVEIL